MFWRILSSDPRTAWTTALVDSPTFPAYTGPGVFEYNSEILYKSEFYG